MEERPAGQGLWRGTGATAFHPRGDHGVGPFHRPIAPAKDGRPHLLRHFVQRTIGLPNCSSRRDIYVGHALALGLPTSRSTMPPPSLLVYSVEQ